jgi:hypothetical protein
MIFLLAAYVQAKSKPKRVLLEHLKELTFTAHKRTEGLRSRAVQQLNCFDGEGCYDKKLYPESISCLNLGWVGGEELKWKCQALNLDPQVRLGETNIICEGFDHRDDAFVVEGSCSLEVFSINTNLVSTFIELQK